MEVSNNVIIAGKLDKVEQTDAEFTDAQDVEVKTEVDAVKKTETDENDDIAVSESKPDVDINDAEEKTDDDILAEAAASATTAVVEETNLTDEDLMGVGGNPQCLQLIEKLGYLPMSLQVFQKMRDTFGSEECEYCGRLFFSSVDYDPHVRTHTGLLISYENVFLVDINYMTTYFVPQYEGMSISIPHILLLCA